MLLNKKQNLFLFLIKSLNLRILKSLGILVITLKIRADFKDFNPLTNIFLE